jgi:hypothetical protein
MVDFTSFNHLSGQRGGGVRIPTLAQAAAGHCRSLAQDINRGLLCGPQVAVEGSGRYW